MAKIRHKKITNFCCITKLEKKKTPSFLEASYRRCPFDTVAQLGRHEASCGRCPFDAVINLVDRKRCPFAAVVNLVVTKHLAQQSYHAKERERESGRERRGVGASRELRHAEKEGGNSSRNFYPSKSSSFRASSAWLLWPCCVWSSGSCTTVSNVSRTSCWNSTKSKSKQETCPPQLPTRILAGTQVNIPFFFGWVLFRRRLEEEIWRCCYFVFLLGR